MKVPNLQIINEPSSGGPPVAAPVAIPVTEQPVATIIKTVTGARSIKLNLEPSAKGKKIDVFYQSATGKLTRIVTKRANKKGDISIKTKMKLKKGGNIIFKIDKKIVR